MKAIAPVRHLIVAAAIALAAANSIAPAAGQQKRTPLLMEGKETLFQRVLTRPGARLAYEPGAPPGEETPALTRFYVYDRKDIDGVTWLEVGPTDKGHVLGWVQADRTLAWKQQLTLAFTNPAGRDRVLFFAERSPLESMLQEMDPGHAIAPVRESVLNGEGDDRIISIEPETHIDISKQFYLLPILEAEETFMGAGYPVRILKIASVSKEEEAAPAVPADSSEEQADENQNKRRLLRNFRAAVVFVIDSTISMGPYIDRTREAVQRIYDRVEEAELLDKVAFGMVAYRSNVEASPGLEYVSHVYANPEEVESGEDFLAKVRDLRPARVSSARFSEDAYAGVMTAIDETPWNLFGGRYLVLITDAGALTGNDPLSATRLGAEQVRLEAREHGVAVYTLHLKTPQGRMNHDAAERQYRVLSDHPLTDQPLYYPVETGSVEKFGAIVDALSGAIIEQVTRASKGELAPGSSRSVEPEPEPEPEPSTDDDTAEGEEAEVIDRLRRDSAMLGYAMELAYLGSQTGERAPPLFSAWIADRDFARPDVAATEVRVLLTKNQLSDMQQVLKSVLEAGQEAQLSPADFFSSMRSAAAMLGRDPNRVNDPKATKLGDLGLLGEYLDDLPYKSKVMSIDQDLWSSWSIGEQQAFLDEVERKLRLYQRFHDDTDRWVALDAGADPGATVYPVPLDALP